MSVATVLSAYLKLENEGLVEVRPKSGHYVRRAAGEAGPPRGRRLATGPARVSVSTGVTALVASLRDPGVVPLGSACVAAELLPIRALNRSLAALARETGLAGATYDAPPGLPTLRRQLARRAIDWGVTLDPSELVTTIGAIEGIHLALRAVARPGDAIVLPTPTYFGVLQLVEELGMRAVEVPMTPDAGLDLDALDDALKRSPVKAVFCQPNFDNPLGTLMPDEAKKRLVRIAARHDVPIIEDDVYGDLAVPGAERPRAIRAFDHEGRVLLVGSVSKTLAPGYRVGWIAPGRYQAAVERLKFALSVGTPTLPQMAVAEYLSSGGYDRHLRTLRARLALEVQRVRASIALHFPSGTRVSAPRGGDVVWVEMPTQVDAMKLQADALANGIAIAPGPIFSARGRFNHCIRVSCGHPWSPRIEQAVRTLGSLAEAQMPAPRARA